MKVCFDTFGCRLNRAEALEMEAAFAERGWIRTEKHSDADLIVVRGCAVTAKAESEVEKLVAHIRRKYPLKRLVVTGCSRSKRNEHWLRDVAAADAVPSRTARAYLKVQDGCSGRCTFCIVPRFRGRAESVPFDDVLAKASRFIEAGYHEIVVTGCNLSQYLSGGRRIADLVAALAALSDGCRIRIGSIEPGAAAADAVRAMSENANVCRFLHVPVQSGSTRILSAMRRPYTARDAAELIRLAEKFVPNLGLGCDLMSGFPGETPNDHLATLAFLERHPFTNAHVFPYSERPGTPAASLPDAVPPDVRSARARELSFAAQAMREKYARRFKGRSVEIVVENEEDVSGWTSEYLWCGVGTDKAKILARRAAASGGLRKKKMRILVRKAESGDLAGDPA